MTTPEPERKSNVQRELEKALREPGPPASRIQRELARLAREATPSVLDQLPRTGATTGQVPPTFRAVMGEEYARLVEEVERQRIAAEEVDASVTDWAASPGITAGGIELSRLASISGAVRGNAERSSEVVGVLGMLLDEIMRQGKGNDRDARRNWRMTLAFFVIAVVSLVVAIVAVVRP